MSIINRLFKSPSVSAVLILLFPAVAGASAVQTMAPKLPAAIACFAKADQSWRIGDLFKIKEGGDAVYIAPDGKLSATVNSSGLVEAPANRSAGLDCYGKTIDELRTIGRTMEFQPTN